MDQSAGRQASSRLFDGAARRRTWRSAIAAALGAVLMAGVGSAWAQTASPLSDAQRRAYLYYYAPLILKQANESSTANWGWDWITNFDYDRDGNFANNLANWRLVDNYVASPHNASYARWKVRPTLYSALIEFDAGAGSKSLVLLYHVYHAQEKNNSIHDWERVELRIDNVSGEPGGGSEAVAFVTVTEHSTHETRRAGSSELKFTPKSAWGHHPIIWQAEWEEDKFRKNELHHVVTPWSEIMAALSCASGCPADVRVTGTSSRQEVHYVFVPQADQEAVALWNAVPLSADNAALSAAKTSSKMSGWGRVKRLTYELQDLADILPTHADLRQCPSTYPTEHGWLRFDRQWDTDEPKVGILLQTGIQAEDGTTLVPASAQCGNKPITFYRYSRDTTDPSDGAQGYPHKHWFWGAYRTDGEGDTDDIFDGDSLAGKKRLCSAGYGKYWCQHDYYAHTGFTETSRHGQWLPVGWHLSANGGFDGRWVQLFDDEH